MLATAHEEQKIVAKTSTAEIVESFTVVWTDSAESYLNQALATYESLYGTRHAKTLEVKDELARLMIRTERIEVGVLCLHVTLNLYLVLLNWPTGFTQVTLGQAVSPRKKHLVQCHSCQQLQEGIGSQILTL